MPCRCSLDGLLAYGAVVPGESCHGRSISRLRTLTRIIDQVEYAMEAVKKGTCAVRAAIMLMTDE